ncbi:UNVERIFIED_CONTAM: hypothetical protein GTU68_029128 [Idotea baltica]|nr:hypothetical protein [Idotea baltica]
MLGMIVEESLASRGFEVKRLLDGQNWKAVIADFQPQICIFDVMLPFIDGFELGKLVRQEHANLPIIFLTAKVQTEDVVKGFHSGGNDYLKKPFSMEELIVRVENLLPKDNEVQVATVSEIQLGKFTFFCHRYELCSDGTCKSLSHKEAELLQLFAQHKNQVLDRKTILMQIWEDDSYFNSRNLDVYITKLRKQLRPDPSLEIKTLKGRGYFFRVD